MVYFHCIFSWLTLSGLGQAVATGHHHTSTPCIASPAKTPASGLDCGVRGALLQPNVIAQFDFITSVDVCAQQCLQRFECGAFAFDSTVMRCQLIQGDLDQNGFSSTQSGEALLFYEKKCYQSNCSPTPIKSCCATSCTPLSTQAVQDPDFENKSANGWKFSGGAFLAGPNPSKAYNGKKYAVLTRSSSGISSFRQSLTNLDTSVPYILQYYKNWTLPASSQNPFRTCNLSAYIDNIPVDGAIYSPATTGIYGRRLGFFTPNYATSTLTLALNCNANIVTPVTVLIDAVTVNYHQVRCKFFLRFNTPTIPSLDGQYIRTIANATSYGYSTNGTTNATNFRLSDSGNLFSSIGRIAYQSTSSSNSLVFFSFLEVADAQNSPLLQCVLGPGPDLALTCAQGANTAWHYCTASQPADGQYGLYLAPPGGGEVQKCAAVQLQAEFIPGGPQHSGG